MSGLADEAVAWPSAAELGLPPLDVETVVEPLVAETALGFRSRRSAAEDTVELQDRRKGVAKALNAYARKHAVALGLNPRLKIQVRSFHAVFRLAGNGLVKVNVVVQIIQTAPAEVVEGPRRRRGPAPRRADPGGGRGRRGPVRGRPPDAGSGSGRGIRAARRGWRPSAPSSTSSTTWTCRARGGSTTRRPPTRRWRTDEDGDRRIAASLTLGRLDRGRPW